MIYFQKFLTIIKKVEIVISVLLFSTIVLIVASQVILRFVFSRPLSWAEELPALLLIYLTFFTADIVYKDKGHIKIDYFFEQLPDLWKRLLNSFTYSLILFVLISIIPKAMWLIDLQSRHTVAAALPLTKSYWTIPVPIAFVSMSLTTLYFLMEELLLFVKKK